MQNLLERLKPSTLATMSAELFCAYNEFGDAKDEHLAQAVREALEENVGQDVADALIKQASENNKPLSAMIRLAPA